jgi:hypothetical protein
MRRTTNCHNCSGEILDDKIKEIAMRVCLWIFAPILLAVAMVAAPPKSVAQVTLSVNITIEPPELPDYDQPEIPGSGYIWTPGYWAWGDEGYYWVPGTWVEPPAVGLLWTPGYWGFRDGIFVWNEGYWGPHIGFYGGVNYGFGYVGSGYLGGSWQGGVFAYNSAVNNFGSVHITNVYNQTIVNNTTIVKVSFNGGPHGIAAQPNAQELAAAHENHIKPTTLQTQNATMASKNRAFLASVNQGKPAIAATSKPGQFSGPGVIAARSGSFHGGAKGGVTGNVNATEHPNPGAAKEEHPNANALKEEHPNPSASKEEHPNPGAAKEERPNANALKEEHPNEKPNNPARENNPPKPEPTAHTPPKGPPPKKDDKEKKG